MHSFPKQQKFGKFYKFHPMSVFVAPTSDHVHFEDIHDIQKVQVYGSKSPSYTEDQPTILNSIFFQWYYYWTIPNSFTKKCLQNLRHSCFFFFNWDMVALQWFISFCYITKQISRTYTYIPSSLLDPDTTLHPIPLDLHRAPSWAPGTTEQVSTSYLLYTW